MKFGFAEDKGDDGKGAFPIRRKTERRPVTSLTAGRSLSASVSSTAPVAAALKPSMRRRFPALRGFRRGIPFGAELKHKVEPRFYALGITAFLPYVGRFFIMRAGGHSPLSCGLRPDYRLRFGDLR